MYKIIYDYCHFSRPAFLLYDTKIPMWVYEMPTWVIDNSSIYLVLNIGEIL